MQLSDHELKTFETVQGSLVTCRLPSEAFRDGGGHSDAYRVFCHEKYPGCRMAFLISDRYGGGFRQCGSADVRSAWQARYGQLLYFNFSRKPSCIEVKGRTAEKIAAACVFPDGGDTMEVMLEIDLRDTPEEVQKEIYGEFEALVDSILIEDAADRQPPAAPVTDHGEEEPAEKSAETPKKPVSLRVREWLGRLAAMRRRR
ncbi:MAG: hypothetical protein HDT14_05760 [Oscillibacter sp.]|nr:hypothetical protein [Oscillibacter sp.]